MCNFDSQPAYAMKIIFTTILFLYGLSGYGQYNTNQNKNWVFGIRAGISFVSGVPVAISSNIISPEGCASVSDSEGNLLFYTEGKKVWDRTNTVMPGGTSICPYSTSSTTQGALIVPVINYAPNTEPSQYYIFSIQNIEDYLWGSDTTGPRLYYSIVDMSLNGGLGDVVPASSSVFLGTRFSEKMIAIPGNNCDMWVLVHGRDTALFYAYNITSCGINTIPVVSVAGDMTGAVAYDFGVMKSSPNRLKIVAQNSVTATDLTMSTLIPAQMGTEIYDFDPATGIVSNCVRVETGTQACGAEFSPDNTKLYSSTINGMGDVAIAQYDITGSAAAITASKVTIATSLGTGLVADMKLAPDKKIYIPSLVNHSNLDCINYPDLPGIACNYQPHVITLLPGSAVHSGLPNHFQSPILAIADTAFSYTDTSVCIEESDHIILTTPFSNCYQWFDGTNTMTHVATSTGHYSITSADGCRPYKHIFNVTIIPEPCSTGTNSFAIANAPIIFPVPATNEFSVHSGLLFPARSMALVYDMTGRLINKCTLTGYDTKISLSGFSAGVYQCRIYCGDKLFVRKLIVAE